MTFFRVIKYFPGKFKPCKFPPAPASLTVGRSYVVCLSTKPLAAGLAILKWVKGIVVARWMKCHLGANNERRDEFSLSLF